MTDLFKTGIRPAIDQHLLDKAAEERDYGDYWPASSAGYCMRKVIMDRLKVPYVKEDARKQRVFSSGTIIHEWVQEITRDAGLSIAQELELQDEGLMIRGHIDDLVLTTIPRTQFSADQVKMGITLDSALEKHLILYDYKSQNSRAFSYMKGRGMSHYHRMQLGTYIYMLRKGAITPMQGLWQVVAPMGIEEMVSKLDEGRILKISRDDLRMAEEQLLWSPELEKEIYEYWSTLNGFWKARALPRCTCADREGGFMAKENYNPYFYQGEPCSQVWFDEISKEKEIVWQI